MKNQTQFSPLTTVLAYLGILFLSFAPLPAQVQVDINFNNTTDLTTFFQADSFANSINSSSGGISNSGAVVPNGPDPDVWTLKNAFSIAPGDTFKSSINFLLQPCDGCIVGVGLSQADSNVFQVGGSGNIQEGLSFGSAEENGGFLVASSYSGSFATFINSFLPNLVPGNWYQFRLNAFQKTNDNLGYQMEFYDLSPTGVLGSQLKSQADSVYNPIIANSTVVYPYFFIGNSLYPDPNFTSMVAAVDGVSFAIVPQASVAVPTLSTWGLIIMALVVLNLGALAIHRSSRAQSEFT